MPHVQLQAGASCTKCLVRIMPHEPRTMRRSMHIIRPLVASTLIALVAINCDKTKKEGHSGSAAMAIDGDKDAGASGSVAFYQVYRSSESSVPDVCFRLFPEPKAIAVGSDGDIWLAGTFLTPLEIGPSALTSAGGADVFIARLDPTGYPRWSAQLGGMGDEECKGIALDMDGNAIVAYQSPYGGNSVLLAKLGPNGEPLWQKEALLTLDRSDREVVYTATSDRIGGILIAGKLDGEVMAGPSRLHGGVHIFLARVNGSGEAQWGTIVGPGPDATLIDLAVDGAGDALVGANNSNGKYIDLAKVDRSGSLFYQQRLRRRGSSDYSASLASIAMDPHGYMLISGAGPVDFGDGSAASPTSGTWIAKVDSHGHRIWQENAEIGKMVVDVHDDVLCANSNSATKFDPSGALVWKWLPQITGDVRIGAVAVDSSERLIIAGSFRGSYDFGSGLQESGPRAALFIAGLTP